MKRITPVSFDKAANIVGGRHAVPLLNVTVRADIQVRPRRGELQDYIQSEPGGGADQPLHYRANNAPQNTQIENSVNQYHAN
jgi:hypothetical protein